MGAFQFRRFAQPSLYQAIDPGRLRMFLRPYEACLGGRGVNLDQQGPLDYERLAEVFMTPEADTPPELLDALYYVVELGTDNEMDRVVARCQSLGIVIDSTGEQSPADIVVQAWLSDAEAVRRIHAEGRIHHPRSFVVHRASAPVEVLDERQLARVVPRLESDLDQWCAAKHRGRGTKIFTFPETEAVWFLIRHGCPFRREGSLSNGEPKTIHFRPFRFDVVVLDTSAMELRINAESHALERLYRERFGVHLGGSTECFTLGEKFTLEPIRTDGDRCTACADVEGIEQVVLCELEVALAGFFNFRHILKADNLFHVFGENRRVPAGNITRAVFAVKFRDARTPRKVTVRPNRTAYTRDDDAVRVDQWLQRRGFVLPQVVTRGVTDAILAVH